MRLLLKGTKKEIKEFQDMKTSECDLSWLCCDCPFRYEYIDGESECRLTNNVLYFLQGLAEFIVEEDEENEEATDNNTKMSETQKKINRILGAMTQLLITKNSRYGNSILDPMRVFCKKDKEESDIPARLDDKLSRIKNSDKIRINDVTDLIGYLVLLLIQLGCTETDILNQID